MSDLLRRTLAPITEAAWQEIEETARQILEAQLSARTIVDFSGPHGWDYAGVNLGTLDVPKQAKGDVPFGVRKVLPLVETRLQFKLNQWELDNVSRGGKNPDLGSLEEATLKIAQFEERAIYHGFDPGCIQGIIPASSHKPIPLGKDPKEYPVKVSNALQVLHGAGVGGPYTMVLGSDAYYPLMHHGQGGYPPKRIIKDLLGGEILWSPVVEGGVVLSTRGGDFEMVVGEDIAIGYAEHTRTEVELFLTESFTFRVLTPEAAVQLKP